MLQGFFTLEKPLEQKVLEPNDFIYPQKEVLSLSFVEVAIQDQYHDRTTSGNQ